MIRVKVISRFKDVQANIYHDPGEVLKIDNARVERLKAAGCVEIIPEPEPKPMKKRKVRRPPKTKALRPDENK